MAFRAPSRFRKGHEGRTHRQKGPNAGSERFHEGRGARKTDHPPGIEGFIVDRFEKRKDMSLSDV